MPDDEYSGMSDEQIAAYESARLKKRGERCESDVMALADAIRTTAYQIHTHLGTGYVEKVYENCLKHRLEKQGMQVAQQVPMSVFDEDGYKIGFYEADLIVDGLIIIELKAVKALLPEHEAQLLNYLKTTHIKDGMLINFGSAKFEILKRAL